MIVCVVLFEELNMPFLKMGMAIDSCFLRFFLNRIIGQMVSNQSNNLFLIQKSFDHPINNPIKNKCTLHPTQLGFNVLVLNVVVGEKFHQIWHLKIIKIGCVTWHRRTKKKSLVKQDRIVE